MITPCILGLVFRFILFLLVTYGDMDCVIGWRNGTSSGFIKGRR
jgi:hypothetical protein